MLLPLLLSLAFSAKPTSQQLAAGEIAESFLFSRPLNIGCDTDPIAMQIPEIKERWRPMCSHGTLTAASNMLVYNLYMFNLNDATTAHAFMERNRVFLTNPNHVRSTYLDLKPFVLKSIRLGDAKRVDEVRGYLITTLIPDFANAVSPELRILWLAEASAEREMLASRMYTTWNSEKAAAYTAANLAFGTAALAAGFHDPLALQWRLRREKEGGQPLVDAYREIFIDFAKSI